MNKIKSGNQRIFQTVLTIIMIAVMLVTVYPMWYSLINSLSSARDISKHGYALLWIRDFTWESWQTVLNDPEIIRAFFITFSRTVIVTVAQTLLTAMFAYGFSRPNLTGKRFYAVLGFLCMYLNGGVIAYFILFTSLHIYDTYWVYIIPYLFGGFYNVIIFNTNFKTIPESLYESAKMDGGSEPVIFFKIVLPLSKPVFSALGIFTAVAMWNDYTQTLYYTRSAKLQTLSYYTLSLMKSSEQAANLSSTLNSSSLSSVLATMSEAASNYKTIELACMILSAIPLIVMYPFAQKFFEKGVMVGSVKG
jgi:ABC-type sugar transport system, permease component